MLCSEAHTNMTEDGLMDKVKRLLTRSIEIPQVGHPLTLPTSIGAWAGNMQEGIPILHVRHVQVKYEDAQASPSCDTRSEIAPRIMFHSRKSSSAAAKASLHQLKRIREQLRTSDALQLKRNRELDRKLHFHCQTHMVLLTLFAIVALLMCAAVAALLLGGR